MSLRFFINLALLGTLFYSVMELKSFLNKNFVENETPLKETVNRALNGEVQ